MTPSGVKSYSHKPMSDDGKYHPDDILSGLETVDKLGGSPPPAAKSGKGSNSPPRGVVRGDGTEKLKGTKVSKKRGQRAKPSSAKPKNYPKEIRQHSGLKAPKSGKQPK